MNSSFLLNSTTLLHLLSWLLVFSNHVYTFNDNSVFLRKYLKYLSFFTFIFSSYNYYCITLLNVHLKHLLDYSTSGANDTIFIKFLSLSSLATGPNIRVPVGCLSSFIITAAFSSNLI